MLNLRLVYFWVLRFLLRFMNFIQMVYWRIFCCFLCWWMGIAGNGFLWASKGQFMNFNVFSTPSKRNLHCLVKVEPHIVIWNHNTSSPLVLCRIWSWNTCLLLKSYFETSKKTERVKRHDNLMWNSRNNKFYLQSPMNYYM